MTDRSWIAYVGPFLFPWGQPGSRRVLGIAAALAHAGHEVMVASGQWGEAGYFTVPSFDNIQYCNIGDLPTIDVSIAEKVAQLFIFSGKKTVDWLEAMPNLPRCVIAYGAGAPFIHRLSNWCTRRGVPLVADVVEWYDPSHMTGGFFGPFHVSSKLAMHVYYPKCSGIIAISKLLESHYSERCRADVIRVPPICDVVGVEPASDRFLIRNNRIKLVYAGSPGKKDLLETVIRGVSLIDPNGELFELQILGPSRDAVVRLLGGAVLPGFVNVVGWIPQSHVALMLQEADFSVLIREPKLFANAGFSTKFVESLSNGTPVIANYTSDLNLYLSDGVEGFVCFDHSPSALAEVLKRILNMPYDQIFQMRSNARRRALDSFDYRLYSRVLSDFVCKLRA